MIPQTYRVQIKISQEFKKLPNIGHSAELSAMVTARYYATKLFANSSSRPVSMQLLQDGDEKEYAVRAEVEGFTEMNAFRLENAVRTVDVETKNADIEILVGSNELDPGYTKTIRTQENNLKIVYMQPNKISKIFLNP